MSGPVVETVTLVREPLTEGYISHYYQVEVTSQHRALLRDEGREVRSASLHPVDEEGREALRDELIRWAAEIQPTAISRAVARSVVVDVLDLLGFGGDR